MQESTRKWRQAHEEELRSDWGWLTVTGLDWLEPGSHLLGGNGFTMGNRGEIARLHISDSGVSIDVLDAGLQVDGAPASSGEVAIDADGRGLRYIIGDQSFMAVRRQGRIGVRTFDNNAPQRAAFPGNRWYDFDASMAIPARFEKFAEPRNITYLTVLGDEVSIQVEGHFVFELAGRQHSLVSTSRGPRPFFVLRDATSGLETYGASRFLSAAEPVAGVTLLDFNRLYSPPCAFTPFATCPLPPQENVLDAPIRAGELDYLPG